MIVKYRLNYAYEKYYLRDFYFGKKLDLLSKKKKNEAIIS